VDESISDFRFPIADFFRVMCGLDFVEGL